MWHSGSGWPTLGKAGGVHGEVTGVLSHGKGGAV